MAKCLIRWTDPAGQLATRMCGRPVGHKGAHASVGQDSSWALWERDGALIMAVEMGRAARADTDLAAELSAAEEEILVQVEDEREEAGWTS